MYQREVQRKQQREERLKRAAEELKQQGTHSNREKK
jgi:heme exporter protein D